MCDDFYALTNGISVRIPTQYKPSNFYSCNQKDGSTVQWTVAKILNWIGLGTYQTSACWLMIQQSSLAAYNMADAAVGGWSDCAECQLVPSSSSYSSSVDHSPDPSSSVRSSSSTSLSSPEPICPPPACLTTQVDTFASDVVLKILSPDPDYYLGNNKTFRDLSPNQKTITRYGDTHHCDHTNTAKCGPASIFFDGNGDYLKVDHHNDFNFNSSDLTIEFWYYWNGNSNFSDGSNQEDIIIAKGRRGGTYVHWHIGHTPLGNTFAVMWNYAAGATSQISINATTNVLDRKWHHIAVTKTNSTNTWELYIDGVCQGEQVTTNINGFTTDTNDPIIIGGQSRFDDAGSIGNFGNFYLEDLRITKANRYPNCCDPSSSASTEPSSSISSASRSSGSVSSTSQSSGSTTAASTGACCVGLNCTQTTQAQCGNLNGIFKGLGTACSSGICGAAELCVPAPGPCPSGLPGQGPQYKNQPVGPNNPYFWNNLDGFYNTCASASSLKCCDVSPRCQSITGKYFTLSQIGCWGSFAQALVVDAMSVTTRLAFPAEQKYINKIFGQNLGIYGYQCVVQIPLIDGIPWYYPQNRGKIKVYPGCTQDAALGFAAGAFSNYICTHYDPIASSIDSSTWNRIRPSHSPTCQDNFCLQLFEIRYDCDSTQYELTEGAMEQHCLDIEGVNNGTILPSTYGLDDWNEFKCMGPVVGMPREKLWKLGVIAGFCQGEYPNNCACDGDGQATAASWFNKGLTEGTLVTVGSSAGSCACDLGNQPN